MSSNGEGAEARGNGKGAAPSKTPSGQGSLTGSPQVIDSQRFTARRLCELPPKLPPSVFRVAPVRPGGRMQSGLVRVRTFHKFVKLPCLVTFSRTVCGSPHQITLWWDASTWSKRNTWRITRPAVHSAASTCRMFHICQGDAFSDR